MSQCAALDGGRHNAPLWSLISPVRVGAAYIWQVWQAQIWLWIGMHLMFKPVQHTLTSDQADGTAPLQWAESLFKELDYRQEARNGIRFRELYGDLEVGQQDQSSP